LRGEPRREKSEKHLMSTSPSTLAITFVNNSNVDASAVYIGFAPGSSDTPVSITNPADGSPVLAVNNLGSYPGAGNWYTLDKLTSGVAVSSFSGRAYVCYDTPWQVQGAGYEPAQAVTDPNFFLRYDKMELTFTGQPADVADLTSIDYWSIPMSLHTLKGGASVGSVYGLIPGTSPPVTAQRVFEELSALTTPPVSGLEGPGGTDGSPLPALVPGQYQQYPGGPAPGTTFARVIGPSSYPPVYPAPGGIPVTPYDLLYDYLGYLRDTFGPLTQSGAVVPTLGAGVIAKVAGQFAGVGPTVPATGPQSRQTYDLTATIDNDSNITLSGTSSGVGNVSMLYVNEDLVNPTGIYGGNTPYYLDGASAKTAPGNDVYGWVGGDLFSGLNIGAVGSATVIDGKAVGAWESQSWFTLPVASFFANLQPRGPFYNRWAATLSNLSQAYNFAYSDRFAHVLVSLDPAKVDTLQVVLEDGTVTTG
jgi:hypothetical protein